MEQLLEIIGEDILIRCKLIKGLKCQKNSKSTENRETRGSLCLAPLIIKIIRDTKEGLFVEDSESQKYPLMFLSQDNIQRFDTYDAIEYFCKHYWHSQQKMIQIF